MRIARTSKTANRSPVLQEAAMSITMKQIADLAEVSTATVSKIINGRDEHISQATREKVLSIIEENNFSPNTVAKGLRVKKTSTIGFVLPDITNPFFPEIARGIEDVANKMGFAVVFCNTDNEADREQACVSFLQSKMVDGLIFTRSLKKSFFDNYLAKNIPTVVVDRDVDTAGSGIGKVYIDTRAAVYDLTKLFIEKGCRRIAFISALSGSQTDRYGGYRRALEEGGIPLDEEIVYREHYSVETGYRGAALILGKTKVDGIVCGNDLIAAGAMQAIRQAGLAIPQDVRIAGVDNIYFSNFLYPPLTTVEQPAYEMGRAAARMLIQNILYGEPMREEKMEYKLILRETV